MTIYQVTAVWEDCEIGYGEGGSLNYAKQIRRAKPNAITAGSCNTLASTTDSQGMRL
jgi:hypothetical protein